MYRQFFSQHGGYLKYYLISFAGIVLIIGLSKLSIEVQKKIIFFVNSLVFSLYFFELFAPKIMKNFPLVEIHNNEKESKWSALQNIKSKGVDIKPQYPPHFMIKDDISFSEKDNRLLPLGLMSYNNFLLCNENGYWATFDSDRYGFNNTDSIWDNKTLDYVLIGDSFTLGSCVHKEKNL